MKRIVSLAAAASLALGGLVAAAPANANTTPLPPNAIVSEGNGAAVFIGYGGDKKVTLSWRPSKRFESTKMLYQVQRGDGTMLVSKSQATQFTDPGLLPNTIYTYKLTSYRAIDKRVKVNGEYVTKTIVKRVGTNTISVLTLPSMVVGLLPTGATSDSVTVTWQPPQYSANPVTYSVYLGQNLMAYDLTDTSYTIGGLIPSTGYTVKVVTRNATGESVQNASVNTKTLK